MKAFYSLIIATFLIIGSCKVKNHNQTANQSNTVKNQKLVIYQLLPRLFGNKNTTNKFYGTKEENGVGKFNDINDKALQELKKLGISHVWYTGIIEHATMTDYTKFDVKSDDPDVVKGIAGSPYAIKDYYDVDPDLAVDVKNRIAEFESLIKRTHENELKVIIDFIPNHVSRTYQSDAKPAGVKDFGEDDDKTVAYSPKNDFYYIPNKNMIVPNGYNAGGAKYQSKLKDGFYDESPVKVTGNNVFKADPSLDDWFETIKLNYGFDLQNNKNHFEPIPPVWIKTRDILIFWAKKGVDGFRCDVAEFAPVEFWNWVIPEVKKVNPNMVFIAEAYDPTKYETFINQGKFDFLYDKVGLYDGLKKLIRNEANADIKNIQAVVSKESVNIPNHMLRFLENHDEERIASKGFAKDVKYAKPAMVISATLSGGPVMIYMGQEVGEPGAGIEGFGGDDNRTTIFDYWGVPNHQKWMNKGSFDGGLLNQQEKDLRSFYQKLLTFSGTNDAIRNGDFIELNSMIENQNIFNKKVYAFVRYTQNQRVLVIANFDRLKSFNQKIKLPAQILKQFDGAIKDVNLKDALSGAVKQIKNLNEGINILVKPSQAIIYNF
jgi:glycosidase